mgnify:CR=1 FL=1
MSSTESDDDGFGACVDEKRVGNRFSAPESFHELMNEFVAREIVTGITAFHVVEMFGFAVRSSGSSKKGTSKTFIISLNGSEKKDRK